LHKHIVGKFNTFEIIELLQGAQIDGIIANSGAYGDDIIFGNKNTKRNVLYGEIAVAWYV